MIEPPPLALIAGMAYLQPRKVPSDITWLTKRYFSRLISSTLANTTTPALFTSTSRRPKCATVSAITSCQRCSSRTSCWRNSDPGMLAATSRPSASLMSVSTTRAPSAANSLASAAPSPEAAPVINTTFPATRPMTVISLQQRIPRLAQERRVL
ncbi:hypothetical protein D3C81_1546630 [compost metagenome]